MRSAARQFQTLAIIRHCEDLRRSNPFFLRAAQWIASAFAKASADKSLRSQ
jgi:hypothetical protein